MGTIRARLSSWWVKKIVLPLAAMWAIVLIAASTLEYPVSRHGALYIAAGASIGVIIGEVRRHRKGQRTSSNGVAA